MFFCWLSTRVFFTGLVYSGGELHAVEAGTEEWNAIKGDGR
jgi:hypothetical protein